jgi:hypothetical protein
MQAAGAACSTGTAGAAVRSLCCQILRAHEQSEATVTPAEAKQVIDVLAGGIDPATGEVLAEDSPVNNPRVIRALHLAAKALELLARKEARSPAETPANVGKPWTEAEDQQLEKAFDAGEPVAKLARAHQRTSGAITSRLVRLGRLQVKKGSADVG